MSEKSARRPLYWEGASKRDFNQFPAAVQKDMGVALFVVQLGGTPGSAKSWKGLGSGVYELIDDHRATPFAPSTLCGSLVAFTFCTPSRRNRR